MYLRNTRPRTTCLYSATSTEPHSAFTASQSSASHPMRAPLWKPRGKGTLLPPRHSAPPPLPEEPRHGPPGGFPESSPEDSFPQRFRASFCRLDVTKEPRQGIEERPGCGKGFSLSPSHLPLLLEESIPKFRSSSIEVTQRFYPLQVGDKSVLWP